jgi:hypothetical protein
MQTLISRCSNTTCRPSSRVLQQQPSPERAHISFAAHLHFVAI